MARLKALFVSLNGYQRRHHVLAVVWAVVRKFSTDQAGLLVVALGWYGFTAIYPLLLVVVTVFGFIGVASLGHGIVNTLHQFPVIGSEFQEGKGGSNLHGSIFGLVIGVLGLVYGAQGVTQTAQTAMNRVWNVPQVDRPGFVPRLLRSLEGLVFIGGAFVINAFLGSLSTGIGRALWVSVVFIALQLAINIALYLATFRVLLSPAAGVTARQLLPGAALGGTIFTALITVGAGLVQHELRHSTATYGAFASVIGVVTFLLLLSKLSIYAAELNPVLVRRLYPRAMPTTDPLPADRKAFEYLAHEEKRRHDERVGVGFEPDAPDEAKLDAGKPDRPSAAKGGRP